MEFIAYIVIGGLAGWIASMIMGRDGSMGIFANIIVGIIGAILGGFLLGLLGLSFGGFVGSLVTATIGAVVLLFIIRAVTGATA